MQAIILMAQLNHAKTRIKRELSPSIHSRLNTWIVAVTRNTIAVCKEICSKVIVVSPDPQQTASLAADFNPLSVFHDSGNDINQALNELKDKNPFISMTEPILIVPNDLPYLTVDRLKAFLNVVRDSCAAIIPSKTSNHNELPGTAILFQQRPFSFPFSYGYNSFNAHLQLAREILQCEPKVVYDKLLQYDVDTVTDLLRLNPQKIPHTLQNITLELQRIILKTLKTNFSVV